MFSYDTIVQLVRTVQKQAIEIREIKGKMGEMERVNRRKDA